MKSTLAKKPSILDTKKAIPFSDMSEKDRRETIEAMRDDT